MSDLILPVLALVLGFVGGYTYPKRPPEGPPFLPFKLLSASQYDAKLWELRVATPTGDVHCFREISHGTFWMWAEYPSGASVPFLSGVHAELLQLKQAAAWTAT